MKNVMLAAIIAIAGMFAFNSTAEATGLFGRIFAPRVRVQRQKVVVPRVQRVVVPQRVVVRQKVVQPQRRIFVREVPRVVVEDFGHSQKVIVREKVRRQKAFVEVEKVVRPQKIIIERQIRRHH